MSHDMEMFVKHSFHLSFLCTHGVYEIRGQRLVVPHASRGRHVGQWVDVTETLLGSSFLAAECTKVRHVGDGANVVLKQFNNNVRQ